MPTTPLMPIGLMADGLGFEPTPLADREDIGDIGWLPGPLGLPTPLLELMANEDMDVIGLEIRSQY